MFTPGGKAPLSDQPKAITRVHEERSTSFISAAVSRGTQVADPGASCLGLFAASAIPAFMAGTVNLLKLLKEN